MNIDWSPVRVTAVAAATGMIVLALFQLALAAGAPWGRAAYGGFHTGTLPAGLRVASAVACAVWTFGALLALRQTGLGVTALPGGLAHWGVWVLAGLLALGTLMNLASSSPWERWFWGPYAFTLAALCFALARAGTAPTPV
ncbi:hypothetical protein [Catellatospora paridis]|uniref:hypothetical protein n=1 Tax=Catellatospora paridis TaxID=1617086 RepID=UPI0012D3EF14|nr:hypothetical protein [Catellatospora paridis]